jgi:molybdopterin-binding protein
MPIGTDFKPFATGGGANVESQPAYESDPLLGTGNQPGIARSNFVNKALRQGTFPTAAISKFMTDELNELVIDDGNLANYEDQFKRAIKHWVNTFSRPQLTANPTFFVNAATGSDSLGTGTAGSPFQTLQKARDVASTFDYAGQYFPTYNCTGAFTQGVRCVGPLIGNTQGEFFVFNSGSSISAIDADCFTVSFAAIVTISATGTPLLLSTSGSVGGNGFALQAVAIGNITVGAGVNFGTCYAPHCGCNSGNIFLNNNYTISGSARSHYLIQIGSGTIITNIITPPTVTLVGTPNFVDAFATITSPGQITSQGVTWSGAATGKRYLAFQNGTITTNGGGASYFPGSIAGTTSNGGQYS